MHDAYRVWKNGRGSFDDVMRAWELLRRHEVDVNVLCTLHAANADHPLEVYRFFRDEMAPATSSSSRSSSGRRPRRSTSRTPGGARSRAAAGCSTRSRAIWSPSVRCDPSSTASSSSASSRSGCATTSARCIVHMFDVTLGAHVGIHTLCIHSPTCGNALALEHNGDLYSCDHFVEPEHLLGNIGTTQMVELVASPKQRAFGQAKADTLPRQCVECDVRFACNGGCPKDRFTVTRRRRARAQLPVPELPPLLPPRRRADAPDGGVDQRRSLRGRDPRRVPGAGRGAGPQRPLSVWQRSEVQGLPRRRLTPSFASHVGRGERETSLNVVSVADVKGSLGRWIRGVTSRRSDLRPDAVAGLPVAIGSVPDGMAASVLAGVSPVSGLYASFVGADRRRPLGQHPAHGRSPPPTPRRWRPGRRWRASHRPTASGVGVADPPGRGRHGASPGSCASVGSRGSCRTR